MKLLLFYLVLAAVWALGVAMLWHLMNPTTYPSIPKAWLALFLLGMFLNWMTFLLHRLLRLV